MGNWRRVRIQITVPGKDVNDLNNFVNKHKMRWYSDRDDQKTDDNDKIKIVWDENEKFPRYEYEDEEEFVEPNENISNMIVEMPFFEFFDSQYGSLCGINNWVSEHVDVIGNIGKDASNREIMKEWRFIAAKFPGIKGEIHVCGDYESKFCVGKVTVGNGQAIWKPPTIKKVKSDDFKMGMNFMAVMQQNGNYGYPI
jgi:hypothetical protein